jgi:Ni/Co efflux regulator RcnB
MKMKLLITMSILAIAAQLAPLTQAQDEEQGRRERRWEQRLANLSQEEREKVRAAHRRAMGDPSVEAARAKMREAHREFRDAMHAAMLKADPTIQPILNKIPPPNRRGS